MDGPLVCHYSFGERQQAASAYAASLAAITTQRHWSEQNKNRQLVHGPLFWQQQQHSAMSLRANKNCQLVHGPLLFYDD